MVFASVISSGFSRADFLSRLVGKYVKSMTCLLFVFVLILPVANGSTSPFLAVFDVISDSVLTSDPWTVHVL